MLLDPALGFFHPNYSRRDGVLCVGTLPPDPYPLDALLEHVYRIVTYQNLAVDNSADLEAAIYFATNPEAMVGLEPVEPIY